MRRIAVVLAFLFVACAHVPATGIVSERLFCGLSIPAGGAVSQAELDAFIEDVVSPRFPQGFTVWRARGQWKGGNEDVMVLEFLHPNDPTVNKAIEEIATEYRTRFHQDAVMRVTMPVRMELEQ
jgi:hypothetical protein